MNEKYLWELWGKCIHPHPKYGGGEMVWPMEFAELIIRECASQVRFTDLLKCNDDSDGEILLQASVQLKEHFGVKND